MVAFLLDDNTAPRKDSVALEQLKANGKRFSYESESTVKDLLQRITQFLSDIMGDSYNKNSDYGLFIPRKKKKKSDENTQLTGMVSYILTYITFSFSPFFRCLAGRAHKAIQLPLWPGGKYDFILFIYFFFL